MAREADREARKALARLRRSVEKAARELTEVERVLQPEEGRDFPSAAFAGAASHLQGVRDFVDEQAERLEAKLLEASGLPPSAGLRERTITSTTGSERSSEGPHSSVRERGGE